MGRVYWCLADTNWRSSIYKSLQVAHVLSFITSSNQATEYAVVEATLDSTPECVWSFPAAK